MEKIKKRKRKKYEMAGLFFILPSLIGVSIFILIPFADVVIRSFQSPITRDFVFFHNYMEVFKNAAFKLAAINTLKFVFICIPLLLIISLTIAVLMQRFIRNYLREKNLPALQMMEAGARFHWMKELII